MMSRTITDAEQNNNIASKLRSDEEFSNVLCVYVCMCTLVILSSRCVFVRMLRAVKPTNKNHYNWNVKGSTNTRCVYTDVLCIVVRVESWELRDCWTAICLWPRALSSVFCSECFFFFYASNPLSSFLFICIFVTFDPI